jgi:hypothetical protein
MNNKHRKTIKLIFSTTIQTGINWTDVESLFVHLGASFREGKGSRLKVCLNGRFSVFHRPHPQKEISRGMVKAIKKFIEESGVLS